MCMRALNAHTHVSIMSAVTFVAYRYSEIYI